MYPPHPLGIFAYAYSMRKVAEKLGDDCIHSFTLKSKFCALLGTADLEAICMQGLRHRIMKLSQLSKMCSVDSKVNLHQ